MQRWPDRVRVCGAMVQSPTTTEASLPVAHESNELLHAVGELDGERARRVALLTPYSGNNLGDAAIQDAVIANLRRRVPDAEFSGITLSCRNFIEKHGTDAFPLCVTDRPFFGIARREPLRDDSATCSSERATAGFIGRMLKGIPLLWRWGRRFRRVAGCLRREMRHAREGYRFLRRHRLLIVSGGGQLDEEWGGPWGHPFALLKWSVLARIAGVPCAVVSVGACKVSTRASRFLLSIALRLAGYRSYRDRRSRGIASGFFRRAIKDAVVPDLAFSLPNSELPSPADNAPDARGRRVVAISPMAYARPQSWPEADQAMYTRYLDQLAEVMMRLLDRDCYLVIVRSALSDDSAIRDLLLRLKDHPRFPRNHHLPEIRTWKDLVAVFLGSDVVIASRLHSTILGFVSRKPVVAISFDSKVDSVMQDCGQEKFLLQIGDFVAGEVTDALNHICSCTHEIEAKLSAYLETARSAADRQYDLLAGFLMAPRRC